MTEATEEKPEVVYASGPISGLAEEDYIAIFAAACEGIKEAGKVPINPLEVVPGCEEGCGSDLKFQDGRYMHTWQCYMKYDIMALFDADAIYMCPGWRASKGANLELQIARALGLKIYSFDGEEALR